MSSWTALTWYTVVKTAFKTKNRKSKSFGILIMKFLNIKSDWRKCIFKEIQPKTTRKLGTHEIGFEGYCSVSIHFRIMLNRIKIIIMIIQTYLLVFIWSKIWSSSQNVWLKLSETTSPQKRFPSDCIALYRFSPSEEWLCTVWCNQMKTIFEKYTFWDAITELMISSILIL